MVLLGIGYDSNGITIYTFEPTMPELPRKEIYLHKRNPNPRYYCRPTCTKVDTKFENIFVGERVYEQRLELLKTLLAIRHHTYTVAEKLKACRFHESLSEEMKGLGKAWS